MDFLQIFLILLIIILGVFLSITGIQVFFILKDMKKAINRLNETLYGEEKGEKIRSGLTTSSFKTAAKKMSIQQKRFFKRS